MDEHSVANFQTVTINGAWKVHITVSGILHWNRESYLTSTWLVACLDCRIAYWPRVHPVFYNDKTSPVDSGDGILVELDR